VQEFVAKNPNWPNLTVEYVRGLDPQLVMKGQVEEIVSVAGWKVESVEEFLQKKLKA